MWEGGIGTSPFSSGARGLITAPMGTPHLPRRFVDFGNLSILQRMNLRSACMEGSISKHDGGNGAACADGT